MTESAGPDLAHRISSLFQAAFTEIGLFVVVFLTVAENDRGEWWWGTNLFIAVYVILLGFSAWRLMKLHSLRSTTSEQTAKSYDLAWRSFVAANATILLYFVAWYFHILWVYAWSV